MSLGRFPFLEDAPRSPEELLRTLFGPRLATPAAGVYPPVNIYDDGERFLVRAEVPGLDRAALEVTLKGDQLTLRGERVIPGAAAHASYHRRERSAGTFRRAVSLPQPVDADRISATYQDGVLEVVLPRVPEAKPRKIAIH